MSTRKLIRAVQQLSQQISRLAREIPKSFMSWLLRSLLTIARPPFARAGFVLPTTILLLLVVSLTVGSIALRTYNRTAEAASERQQRVIYNAATPAIDRAKAKLEYLFGDDDPRLPEGTPRENQLLGMMLNPRDGVTIGGLEIPHHPADRPNVDPYTFPGETRINLNAGNEAGARYTGLDNAWTFRTDTDGDGALDATVAYSILFQTPTDQTELRNSSRTAIAARANSLLQVRNAPLSNTSQANASCQRNIDPNEIDNSAGSGWTKDEASGANVLRKNFQVDAYVLPDDPAKTAVSTLEFFQDRKSISKAFGAWFRNDLEIFPGPQFNWNGSMHTEGSLVVGKPFTGTFTSFLISSPDSCLFSKENSEITVGNFTTEDANNGRNGGRRFMGQVINGTVRDDNFDGNSIFHLLNTDTNRQIADGDDVALNAERDSVNNLKPSDYTLDPVVLQTEGNSVARGVQDPQQNALWLNRGISFVQKDRIFAQKEDAPNVDDSYRADNRWGPKPNYRANGRVYDVAQIGETIGNLDDLIKDEPIIGAEVGVDGYWERRARLQGLRLIVGQRLELGNAFGWNFGSTGGTVATSLIREPLRPWLQCSSNNSSACNQARQRRSLYDNLAAVQATAVYHASNTFGTPEDRDRPLACLATTVHPGTSYTLERSATFENLKYDLSYPDGGSNFNTPGMPATIYSDFFRGRGTNGWEYNAPPLANLQNAGTPLRKAMRNLANYAGDPDGGAPSFMPTNTREVHPFPSLAMWGDFSMLRRVLNSLEVGASYASLSPADKTTLHTAACTLGMLAHNIDYLNKYTPATGLDTLGQFIQALVDPSTSPAGLSSTGQAQNPARSPGQPLPTNSQPEDVFAALEEWRDRILRTGGDPRDFDKLNQAVYMAQMLATKEQVYADRRLGFFANGSRNYLDGSLCAAWNSASDALVRLCSRDTHYPILYSLFPESPAVGTPADHGESAQTRDGEDVDTSRTWRYIQQINPGTTVYRGITDTDIAQMALTPKPLSNWILPNLPTSTAGATPNSNRNVFIRQCSSAPCLDASLAGSPTPDATASGDRLVQVAFKDSALMNGRELVNVRVLDMDLNLMRQSSQGLNSDRWLPKSGIVYAFREDAVGESSIVRPQTNNWASCNNNTALQTVACRMDTGTVSANASTDPPLNSSNLISPKPVDYYPDPDRRPNGFRLRNGTELSREGDQGRGLSLVSDNPIYIQGDFNLHRNGGGTRLEEFRTLLADDYSNFYQRTNPTDPDFAISTRDRWRPAEILADAVTILSNNFCDGSIQDGFLTAGGLPTVPTSANPARYGCQGQSSDALITSYLNQGRPSSSAVTANELGNRWMRANQAEATAFRGGETGRSPIRLDRFANPFTTSGGTRFGTGYDQGYVGISEAKPRNNAAATRVNATIVSGIVPSRPNQSYGGLHNFPRFIEDWNGQPLFISGSFVQLTFSNYATAPFDQDAFEVGATPGAAEQIKYYEAPNRRWGYDVGLQYAAAGPLASRFQKVERVRSEFYNEPPADDPYILNLCRAIDRNRCSE